MGGHLMLDRHNRRLQKVAKASGTTPEMIHTDRGGIYVHQLQRSSPSGEGKA